MSGALGLTALRRSLGYPDVLTASTAGTLAAVRDHGLSIGAALALAGIADGLLVPITVGLVRLLPRGPHRPLLMVLATAAAAAQLTGVLFWLVSVPALARRAAIPAEADHALATFDTARTLFGVMAGEVLACLLTASWTFVLLAQAARSGLLRGVPGRAVSTRLAALALAGWGGLAAGGMLGGTLLPFGVDTAITVRVIGQLVWYVWLVGLAVVAWHLVDAGTIPPAGNGTSLAAPVPAAPPVEAADPGRRRHHTADSGSRAVGSAQAADPPTGQAAAPLGSRVAGTPRPRPAHDAPTVGFRPGLDDAFFEAATEIGWASRPSAGVGGSLRAHSQPAGGFLGDDNPTEPVFDASDPPLRTEPGGAPPSGLEPAGGAGIDSGHPATAADLGEVAGSTHPREPDDGSGASRPRTRRRRAQPRSRSGRPRRARDD
ncbi:hypothetical protein [Frankia sp. AgB32]|uniref:hypothetical protein n=1 Tax=Frankia sp. AgB32 TaxID=631119 RepID=UPI00200DA750|nr:hypothetical protein [Frankia sp. AgB32]MCK9895868.1 hypothetical protein [Frankia sp. AgB32]